MIVRNSIGQKKRRKKSKLPRTGAPVPGTVGTAGSSVCGTRP